jgi:HNH endonuclease
MAIKKSTRHAPLAVRFTNKYQACPMSGCWLWLGSIMSNGYGKFHKGGVSGRKKDLAHRVSYELHIGPVSDDVLVLHRCDVRSCVNPAHLFLGSGMDNMRDMHSKGRGARGEISNLAKLSLADVRDIRNRGAANTQQFRAIAGEFGVSCEQIRRIIDKKTWRWAA